MQEPDFPDVLQHFELAGHFESAQPFGSGHINDTWLIKFVHADARKRYVLQRINSYVFKEPIAVSRNIDRVCQHIANSTEGKVTGRLPGQADFVPIRTRSGESHWQDGDGQVWRLWPFIYGASTVDKVHSAAQAREAASAFGEYQRLVADLPGPPLHETIAGFHDTLARFEQFREALKADSENRAASCEPEIEFALATETTVREFTSLVTSGELPVRIAHNDAKINNVMLDDKSGKAVCVIDLDTVMPGVVLFDFGDMVRTMTVLADEDETDLDDIEMDTSLYAAIAEGYLDTVGDWLSPAEIAHLPDAGRIITIETGLRFLADHLSGDPYFRISRPNQNLDRCRTQFALVRSIERHMDELRQLTEQAVAKAEAAN